MRDLTKENDDALSADILRSDLRIYMNEPDFFDMVCKEYRFTTTQMRNLQIDINSLNELRAIILKRRDHE